ncbi:hypothetical protein BD410DRAFT_585845 [Rickenella mellea]|uniref:Uncharacterized protein n=1 Tax=Rickenella mellea TaxID=50990 RepID=A0A4Y7PR64_9AGAM|nr:hypothetical protein BD410DRAFT_585845 [Rickenella mellea]
MERCLAEGILEAFHVISEVSLCHTLRSTKLSDRTSWSCQSIHDLPSIECQICFLTCFSGFTSHFRIAITRDHS